MIPRSPKDGQPPERSVLKTGNLALKAKVTPGDNCKGCSIKIPRRVTHQPKYGHPPEGSVPLTWNLAITFYTSLTKLTPGDNCHGWSPTILRGSPANPRMVTHQIKDGHLVWPCLALIDTILPGFPMFGPVLALFGPVLAPFGTVWPHLPPFCPILPHFALFGPV